MDSVLSMPISRPLVSGRWLEIRRERLQLPGATLHGFRRTGAVRLYEAGVELPTIQAMTGHSDLKTLVDRYLPIAQRHKVAAMEKLQNHLDSGQIVDKPTQLSRMAG